MNQFPHVVIPRSEHSISRAAISSNALKVLYRLKEAGYQAFLVGGAVRDLLLGITPKDFDVATNALPDEVRRLFRNCRLIGRRFRLAHVHFGQEIIEVATFRAAASPEREDDEEADAELDVEEAMTESDSDSEIAAPAAVADDPAHRAFDTTGRILRDNIYGTIDEDVWRRDFAANGLYYNIEDFSIWDFVDGVADVRARRLKLIGDPETRYREDPVRMLRAVRFAAKLDFSIEPRTEEPIRNLAHLLDGVPPARLFDEVLKLFLSGFGAKSFRLLQQYHLFEHLFPMSAAAMSLPPYAYAREMLELGLVNTDERIAADKPVTPTFLFAILLWGAVLRELNEQHSAGPAPDLAQLMQACDTVLRAQQSRVSIPRRFSAPMRELLMLQPRFSRRSGVKSLSILQHPRFRAAYDFLLLRAQAGVADPELAQWWTDVQLLPHDERVALVQARPADAAGAAASAQDGAAVAPGRRRRRRRGGAARS
ncbi:MAG TPA: polynucleotide adenylyltransferase PcnB [Steroidobacteraceae bacterium]|nr:polynucleotide adenylyltransferase PcnB [Steroidobacteraceae bacterium]